jgi:hypothetical protein
MRKIFLASAGIAATLLGVGAQAEAATGFVGASVSRANVKTSGVDTDADIYGISGATAFDLGGMGVQLGAGFANSDSDDAVSADAHLYGKFAHSAIGGFAAVSNGGNNTTWTVGGELNGYMTNSTFASTLGWTDAGDLDATAVSIDGELRFFLSDNFRLDVGGGYFNISDDVSAFDTDGYTYGAGAEYQLSSVPISVYFNWNHADTNDTDVTADISTLGVRYNFNSSLKERDRSGPSMGTSSTGSLKNVF